MKKILLLLFILFSFTSSGFAANWYWLGATPDGTQWYVDNNDVIKTDMSAKVWTKIMRSNGKFSVTRVYVDRRNKMLAIISNTNYNANGVVLYQHVPTYVNVLPPKEAGDFLQNQVKKYPPTSINDFLTQAPIILNTKNRIWYSANGTDPWYSAEFNFVTKKAKELHIKY